MKHIPCSVVALLLVPWLFEPLSGQAESAEDFRQLLQPALTTDALILGRLIRFRDGSGVPRNGELLAVNDRSMWLLSGGVATNVAFSGIDEIQVRRHGFGAGKVWTWIGIGAAATGFGMSIACSSYADGSGCGGVFLGMALSWAIVGGLSSLDVVGSSWAEVAPSGVALRRYSRFPQGLPDSYGSRAGRRSDAQRAPGGR